jgi:Fe-S-cluster containining protein
MFNQVASARLNNAVDNVKSLDELYEITNITTDNVKKAYPNILCKSGCNACCKTYGSPAATPLEWEKIKNFLDIAPADYRDKVKKGLQEVKDNLRKMVTENPDTDPGKIINNIKCPFLHEEVCSIYPIRPLICRMFGNFAANPEIKEVEGNVIFTCEMEKDRWNSEIESNQLQSLVLPNREYFMGKLSELNGNSESLFLVNRIDDYFKQNNYKG